MPDSTMASVRRTILAVIGSTLLAAPIAAQDTGTRSPISIGNYPDVAGLRINFRDRDLGRVDGVNITVWSPYQPDASH